MRQRMYLTLAVAVLAVGMVRPTAPGAFAADDAATQTVDIPGTDMTATLPADWRIWFAKEGGDRSELLATDVATRQSCTLSHVEGLRSAERAAHEPVETVEAQAQYEVVERTFLVVPAGNAVRVSYRFKDAPDDARYLLNEYYLTAPEGVVRAYCAGDEPPADRWLSVIEGIAAGATDPQPAVAFDGRVNVPAHGVAIDFPEEWLVRSWTGPGPVLGGQVVLRAITAVGDAGCGGCECVLEDDSVLPVSPVLVWPAEWRATLISSARANRHEAVDPVVTFVDTPSGPVVRADWERWSDRPGTSWIYLDSDGQAVAALLCRADAPPDDGWSSIAETLDLLSAGT